MQQTEFKTNAKLTKMFIQATVFFMIKKKIDLYRPNRRNNQRIVKWDHKQEKNRCKEEMLTKINIEENFDKRDKNADIDTLDNLAQDRDVVRYTV